MVVYIKNGETHFDEALLDYVEKGSITVLESFFRKNNSKLINDTGRTLLHYAAKANNGRGETISTHIYNKINSEQTFKTCFESCQQQLEIMKNTVFHESVTLHKLLTKSQPKITRYARNHEFPSKFKKAMKVEPSLFSYYSISLRKRVGKAIHLAKLKEEAVVMLNNIFEGRIKNYKEILYAIVEFLTCDDIKNVCKVFDLQESEFFHLENLFV